MDESVYNGSQLVDALDKMTMQHNLVVGASPPPKKEESNTGIPPAHVADLRSSSAQTTSYGLMQNLNALTTSTNAKLDVLVSAISYNNRVLQSLLEEQRVQTEHLATIARNTSLGGTQQHTSGRAGKTSHSKYTVKDYGFTNPYDVAADLVMRILVQADSLIRGRGIAYVSTSTLKRSDLAYYIKAVCETPSPKYEDENGTVKLPENKHSTTLRVASKLGSVDESIPILKANALRDLVLDPECRTFMSAVELAWTRMRLIAEVLPHYESDIVNSTSPPFFDVEGDLMCDWAKLRRRPPTDAEASVYGMRSKNRKTYVELRLKGVSVRAAISAATQQ